jgi:hypothetical protein
MKRIYLILVAGILIFIGCKKVKEHGTIMGTEKYSSGTSGPWTHKRPEQR